MSHGQWAEKHPSRDQAAPHRSRRPLLRSFLQEQAPPLHHLRVGQLEGAQNLRQGQLPTSDACVRAPAPPSVQTYLSQLQCALVLNTVVRQGQPEKRAIQSQALENGGPCKPRASQHPQAVLPHSTHICNVARSLVPDVVESQVQRNQGPVAVVQCGQCLAQELRPVVVDAVVPQR